MNIYVVSTVWWREGATVIGAATDRAGAEVIADRYHSGEPGAAGWAPWKEDVSPSEGSCTWRRDALLADGTVHPSGGQEIVCVPLAGMPELPDFAREWVDMVAKVIPPAVPEPGKTTVTYPWADDANVRRFLASGDLVRDRIARINAATDAMRGMIEMVSSAKASYREMHGEWPDRIRVGSGAAWDYFERAADAVAMVPDPASEGINSVMGIPVVLDPDMPPDQFRIGDQVITIGTADGIIGAGRMVSINEGIVRRFTNPPS